MQDLKNSGLVLRTIQPNDYARLVEDIQYNFTQILSLSGFKGSKGDSIKGDTGIGIRGSKWIFVSLNDFDVQSINDLNLDYINNSFVNNPDSFKDNLTIPDDSDLVYGDTLVLPSGQIIQLITTVDGDIFVDTGVSFQQVSGLSADEVVRIVQSLIGDTQENLGFKYYNAVAKNVDDSSPAQNQNLTQDSAVDIVVTGSGQGVNMPLNKFYAPFETQITEDMMLMEILGSPKRYHELVQATQQQHSNAYTTGVDDWASLAILQNSYKNGIIFGNRLSNSIRDFGRLYKSENATVLTSSYSPLVNEFSELNLFDNKITLRVQELIELKSRKFDFQGEEIQTRSIKQLFSNNVLELILGVNNTKTTFDSNNIIFDKHKDANFLTTDASGKLIKKYKVATDIVSNTNDDIVSTAFLNNKLQPIQSDIDDLIEDVEELMNADSSINFRKLGVVDSNSPDNLKNLNGENCLVFGYTVFNLNIFTELQNTPYTDPPPTASPTNPYGVPTDIKGLLKTFVNKVGTKEYIEQRFTGYYYIPVVSPSPPYYQIREFVRVGVKENNVVTFRSWYETVVGHGALNGDEVIYRDGNRFRHRTQLDAESTQNTGTQLIQNIEFDGYGHVVNTETIDLNASGLLVPSGSVFHIASTTVPSGYLACRGQYVNAIQYPNLYRALLNTFGETTPNTSVEIPLGGGIVVGSNLNVPNVKFKLPDLRGQFIRGWNNLRYLSLDDSENRPDWGRNFGTIQGDLIKRHKHATIWGENSTDAKHYPYGYIGNGSQWGRGSNQIVDKDNWIPLTNDGSTVSGQGGVQVANPNPDGSIGGETRPTNIALLAIIKI